MLSKIEKINHRVSDWFEWIAMLPLLVMMLITFIDVIGAKVFIWRLPGALDIVMISQAVAIAFAASMLLILDRHVRVSFLVDQLPKRVREIIEIIVHLLEFGLFVIIIWRLFVFGYNMQIGGEGTATIRVPLYPIGYGMAVALIPCCVVIFLRFIESVSRVVRR